jgi:2-hydroxychromene-2-carboxylate isomerase
MSRSIDYYFSCISPWSYLGHARFIAIAKQHTLTVAYRPVPLARLFAETGGVAASKRHPARQDYRLIELQRWRDKLGVDLKVRPKYWPFNPSLADRIVIALATSGRVEDFLPQAFTSVFSGEQNLADEEVVASLLASGGLASKDIIAAAKSDRSLRPMRKISRPPSHAASLGRRAMSSMARFSGAKIVSHGSTGL